MTHPLWPWSRKKESPAEMPDAAPATAPVSAATVAPGDQVAKRSYSLSDPRFWKHFNLGYENLANVEVTQQTAMGVPPFFGAVRYIAEGVAMLDRKVKIRMDDGVHDAVDHPVWDFVNGSPHPHYTWFDLICAILTNACLGNGYARIHWDYSTMRPMYFEHLPSIYVHPQFDYRGNLWYDVMGQVSGKTVIERLPPTDVIHIKGPSLDGILGLNMLWTHQSVFATGISRQQYSESVLGQGARPSIAIKHNEELDEKEVAAIEENVMRRIGGSHNAGRPLVLDAGQDIQYIQWSPLEAALEVLSNMNIEDVVRLTKVPRDFLGLDNHGTYEAGVQRSKDLLLHCLNPWVEKFQEEFDRKVFWQSEVRGRKMWYEFDTSMYVAMDKKDETEMLVAQVRGMIRTPNEARAVLGLPPTDYGDTLYGDINFLPIASLVEIATAKYLSAEGEKLHVSSGAIGEKKEDLANESEPSK